MEEMQTADELLSEGTVKLQTAVSSGSKVDSQGAKVACLMIETAKSNQAKAKRKLEAVREKQKVVNTQAEIAGKGTTNWCFCSAIKQKKVKLKDEQSFYSRRCSHRILLCLLFVISF